MKLKEIVQAINLRQQANLSILRVFISHFTKDIAELLPRLEPKDFMVTGESVHEGGNVIIIPQYLEEDDRAGKIIFNLAEFKHVSEMGSEEFELIIENGIPEIEDTHKLRIYLKTLLIVEESLKERERLAEMFEDVVLQISQHEYEKITEK